MNQPKPPEAFTTRLAITTIGEHVKIHRLDLANFMIAVTEHAVRVSGGPKEMPEEQKRQMRDDIKVSDADKLRSLFSEAVAGVTVASLRRIYNEQKPEAN